MSIKDDNYDPLPDVERFVRRVQKRKDETELAFMGIDPGASGAIAFLCGKHYLVIDIPTMTIHKGGNKKFKNTTVANFPGICRIFKALKPIKQDIVIFIETIPIMMGKRPKNPYGQGMIIHAQAIWPLFLYSKGFKTDEANPRSWKAKMKLTGKNKEASRQKAIRLYPQAPLHRKMDSDRAEALLIATWGRRLYEGKS